MAGREVREYTNLTDPKDRKWGKGKDKIDDEDITFQRMVAKMQEVSGERGGYLHGRGALDSDDLLYLKEQMEAEEDAERLLRRTEKRAFAAFKKAASLADSSPVPLPLPLRIEPKQKSGIRQQDILKQLVEIKPKRLKDSNSSDQNQRGSSSIPKAQENGKTEQDQGKALALSRLNQHQSNEKCDIGKRSIIVAMNNPQDRETESEIKTEETSKNLLGLSYESSDED